MMPFLPNARLAVVVLVCAAVFSSGAFADETSDNLELLKQLHALFVKTAKNSAGPQMADYSAKIPKTGAAYHMVAIKGGEFLMGSPPSEAHREKNEGPQVKVTVDPFWMGKYEVTWDEYEPYMVTQVNRRKNGSRPDYDPKLHSLVDAVSQPTAPYMEMSFGMGQQRLPGHQHDPARRQ